MLTRKSFLTGTAAAAAAMTAGAFAGVAQADEAAFGDAVAWDAAYDVVVVGFGDAGAATAITAAESGAKVLPRRRRRPRAPRRQLPR